MSPSSGSSNDAGAIAAAGAVPGSAQDEYKHNGQNPYRLDGVSAGTRPSTATTDDGVRESYVEQTPSPVQQRDVYVQPSQQEPQAAPPQDRSFLVDEPAPVQSGPARHDSNYAEWLAPTAAGVAGAGVGAAGYAAYQDRQQDEAALQSEEPPMQQEEVLPTREAPETYQPTGVEPGLGTTASTGVYYVEDTPVAFNNPEPTAAASPAAEPSVASTVPLGGLERDGARETGQILPKVVRHDTSLSISKLHVPGEYPKTT